MGEPRYKPVTYLFIYILTKGLFIHTNLPKLIFDHSEFHLVIFIVQDVVQQCSLS